MADLFTQQISHPVKKAAPRTALLGEIGRDVAIEKRTFTSDDRKKLADSGAAMPGGRYPITQPVDVANAVKDYNRTGQDPAVKAHIISRAKAIGATGELPDDWITKYNENHDDHGRFSAGDGDSSSEKPSGTYRAQSRPTIGNPKAIAAEQKDTLSRHVSSLARQNAEPLDFKSGKSMGSGSKTGPWPIDRND